MSPVPRKWKKVCTAAGVAAAIGVGMLGVNGVGDDPADGSGTGGAGDQPGVSRQEQAGAGRSRPAWGWRG